MFRIFSDLDLHQFYYSLQIFISVGIFYCDYQIRYLGNQRASINNGQFFKTSLIFTGCLRFLRVSLVFCYQYYLCDREKLLKLYSRLILRSQFIKTVKGQNNLLLQNATCSLRFLRYNKFKQLELKLEKNIGIQKH